MAKDAQKTESQGAMLIGIAIIVMGLACYWQLAPMLAQHGISNKYVNMAILLFKDYFKKPMAIKLFCFIMIACASAFRIGKKVEKEWSEILIVSGVGIAVFFITPKDPVIFTLTAFFGMIFTIYGLSLIFRKMKGEGIEPDENFGFAQNTRLRENKNSVNIPYKFIYKGQEWNGWINFLNVFRATMVLGSPGSGKSFAVYNAFIEQMIRKDFMLFVYDYKFPDLTERVLTEIAYQTKHDKLWANMKKKPHLYIINFDDPMRSNRCNPIHHSYITDPADTSEIADLVFKNINKGSDGKGFDFFNESAKVLLDAVIYWLALYDPDALYNTEEDVEWIRRNRGEDALKSISKKALRDMDGMTVIGSKTNYEKRGCYCSFPYVIEVMAYNYTKTFQILQFTKGLEAKLSPFASALENQAMEQISGQIASAQIPLGKFVSPALYWVMSGDDFTLDINNPDEPKIVCMGNNPDRQTIYGTTLALYTSRMFKLINHKHKLKSAVLLDELPTIFIKGLDNLIATARSNKVAIVMGAQDGSQLRRDYGDKEAEVIETTTGNMISGSVEGRTAERLSKNFGKHYVKHVSQSISDDSTSQSISYQLEEKLPASEIVDMSQGMFCGWVKDNFGEFIPNKKFYGEIIVDAERNEKLDAEFQSVPIITRIFGDTLPEMTDEDCERLMRIHAKFAYDKNRIYQEFLKERVNEETIRNFNKIKDDVKELIESEFKRTEPMAQAYREANGLNE